MSFESLFDTILARSPAQPLFLWKAERKLTVLAYHGVENPGRFEWHLRYIKQRMHPITMEELLAHLDQKAGLPKRAVLITFDDADRTIQDVAAPLLKILQLPALAFVVAGHLKSTAPFWWNEVKELAHNGGRIAGFPSLSPEDLVRQLKTVDDSRRLQAIDELRKTATKPCAPALHLSGDDLPLLQSNGISIGNHSLSHPCMNRCSEAKIENEIVASHAILTRETGKPPLTFAYPNGDADPRIISCLERHGYRAGFLFDHRVSLAPHTNRFEISRLRVNSTTTPDRFQIILSGIHPALHQARLRLFPVS